MKHLKIMLTAVVLLGTVGGVLAYKANAKRFSLICTRPTVNGQCNHAGNCQGGIIGKITASPASLVPVCTTQFDPAVGCLNQQCAVVTRTTNIEP